MSEIKDLKRRREGDDAEDNTEQLALPKACGRTQDELDGLLKEVDSGSVKYERYFFKNKDATGKGVRFHRTNLDEDIDRCLRCGMTVSEHNPAAAAAPHPLPAARCAVPTVFVTFTANLTRMCGEDRHELLQTCVEALKLSATPENRDKKEAHPFHVLVSSPRQGKSRWLDELVVKINAHPIEVNGVRLVAIPFTYNGWIPMCEEDWSPATFAARFFWHVLHTLHMSAGMTGMKPLWAFVSETREQHGIDPSNADAVREIINRSYDLDKVRVVVCADEFSKPYGMLKKRCQKLYPGSAWGG